MKKVSVIVCTYNREKYIANLIQSLLSNKLEKSQYELIIIDNNCTDNTENICQTYIKNYPDNSILYFKESEQGLSASKNRGIKEAHGEIIIFVDDDAFVDSNYLSEYVEYFDSYPEVMALGGPIQPYYETSEPLWMTKYTKALLTAWMDYGNTPREYPKGRYPGGGNAAYRKIVFDKVGLFNTQLGRKGQLLLASEEKDIFDKMHSLKMPVIYIPGPVLHHCIPAAKLESDYFERLTLQIGKSERRRTLSIGKRKYLNRLLSESVKWCGTIVLFCSYLVRGQFQKGWKLILFRKNVSKGLLTS